MEKRISGHTRLYCLIGSPVGHSGSPAMYNYSFNKLGIDSAYLAFDITLDKMPEALAAIHTFNVGGFNITMPGKRDVLKYVDEVSPAANLIGASNTVVVTEEGKLVAHNTDGIGFVRNLQEHGVEVKNQKIVLLGAGGAATAIAVQTALDGAADIMIFNIKDEFFANAEATAAKLNEAVPSCNVTVEDMANQEALEKAIGQANILVNATKMGMKPLEADSLIRPAYFRKDLVVADTVYNPRQTVLIKEAEKAGCKAAIGGIGMLLWQGVAAFKLFTGQDMPVKEVEAEFFS
jgi:shikimate dehydrogenase